MIKYQDILNYLEAIAAASGEVPSSPHGFWWKPDGTDFLTYSQFKTGTVPGVGPPPVPIMNTATPEQSPFYEILLGPITVGGAAYLQMPDGGPYITDGGGTGTFTLPDGSTLTGKQIQDNIKSWLDNGFPE